MNTLMKTRLVLGGLAVLTIALVGCGAPPEQDGVDQIGKNVQIESGLLRGPFGGNGWIDRKDCSLGPFNCVRTVGRATRFDLPARGRIRELRVWSGKYIDALQVLWQSESNPNDLFWSEKIGGGGGGLSSLALDPDEAINFIRVGTGKFVDSITVGTTKGREKAWGGSGGGLTPIDLEGDEVHGFAGMFDPDGYIQNISFWSYLP